MRISVAVCALILMAVAAEEMDDAEFTNTWVAEIEGGEAIARRVARDHGYVFEGPVDPFDDHYVLTRDDHPDVSKRNSHHLTRSLTELQEVKWAEQQVVVKRSKRGIIPDEFPEEQLLIPRDFDHIVPEEHKPFVPRASREGNSRGTKNNDMFALLMQQMNGFGGSYDDWYVSPWSSYDSWSNSWSSPSTGSSKPGQSSSSKPANSGSSSKPVNSGSSSKPANSGSSSKPVTTASSSKPVNTGSSKPDSSSSSKPTSGSSNPLNYFSDLAAEKEGSNQTETKKLGNFPTVPLDKSILRTYSGVTKHVGSVSTKKSAYERMFNDPLWTKQWYTQDYRTSNMPVMDHNVVPVYRKGITGKGVKVAVVDDGIEHGHPDLEGNFMESLSYDMCNNKVGSEPDPAYQGHPNSHGTKCAGEIAMVANNSKCGVGIAYHSKVAGIKTLGKRSYDLVEARGLVHKLDTFDIYSNSWGPSDDGKTMEKMGSMVAKSLLKGVTEGRKGKGAIYTFAAGNGRHQGDNCAADGFINNPYTIPIASVSQHGKGRKGKGAIYTFAAGNGRHQGDNCAADGFINNPYTIPIASVSQHGKGRKGKGAIYTFAAGNGRHQGDNCAADGFINNPYTIPIASVSQHGKVCYYSERCTAIFAATYSGGNRYDEKVATIDLNGKCATDFTGTSAATPIATGIIALTLQANPNLSYRDVMHLITMTAEVAPVANNEDIWYKNGRGFWVSNDFGFGLLNADNLVSAARDWKSVPEKSTCVVMANLENPQYLTVGQNAKIQFKTSACRGTKDAVNFLEQIEVVSTIDYPHRGALSITIRSPSGTESDLLETRKSDNSRNGLKEWSIKSVHNWGEDPKGTWVIQVAANALEGVKASSGYVQGFTITFHGTAEQPAHYKRSPVRTYSAFRLPNGKTSEV